MSDCIFCKIITGEISSLKVYENEDVLAILDIAPVNHGHTLIFPKKHFANLEEIPKEDLAELMKVVKKIGKAMKYGMGKHGYNIQVNNDSVAGKVIPHLHFHVIPRSEDDGLELWPQCKYKGEEEIEDVLKMIKRRL